MDAILIRIMALKQIKNVKFRTNKDQRFFAKLNCTGYARPHALRTAKKYAADGQTEKSGYRPVNLHTLTDFIKTHAASAKARWGLYGLTALESVIFPIPVDPLMAACVYARSNKWVTIGLFTAFWSVVGGAVGWYLGFALQDFVADMLQLLPHQIAGPEKFSAVSAAFADLGIILVLIGAFTPLPYKVIAVSAGLFGYSLLPFVVFSLIGRGARFLLVAGLVAHRHDFRLVIGFLSALLILVGTGMWIVS